MRTDELISNGFIGTCPEQAGCCQAAFPVGLPQPSFFKKNTTIDCASWRRDFLAEERCKRTNVSFEFFGGGNRVYSKRLGSSGIFV